jgi:hypothetical protein
VHEAAQKQVHRRLLAHLVARSLPVVCSSCSSSIPPYCLARPPAGLAP